jgi:hypothetical protein
MKQAVMAEVLGVLDVYKGDIAEALAHTRGSSSVSEEEVRNLITEIAELFRTGKIGRSLPFFNTQIGLHSLFRWNHAETFKSNDWLDYYHAGAALPYFDIFLTERSLAAKVTSPSLRFDTLYETRVCSDPEEALQILDTF